MQGEVREGLQLPLNPDSSIFARVVDSPKIAVRQLHVYSKISYTFIIQSFKLSVIILGLICFSKQYFEIG